MPKLFRICLRETRPPEPGRALFVGPAGPGAGAQRHRARALHCSNAPGPVASAMASSTGAGTPRTRDKVTILKSPRIPYLHCTGGYALYLNHAAKHTKRARARCTRGFRNEKMK